MSTWLVRAASDHAEAIALNQGSDALDYAGLAEQASLRAALLDRLGVRIGDRVMLEAPTLMRTAVWFHALLWLGAAVIPVGPSLRPHQLETLLRRLKPQAFIASSSNSAAVSTGPDHCTFIDAGKSPPPDMARVPAAAHDPARVATIMLTSGSSSIPKAVPLTLGNHEASTTAISRRIAADSTDHWLLCLPLEHIGGLAILIRSVILGNTVTLLPGFDPARVVAEIGNRQVTLTSMVPSMLDALVQSDQATPAPSLRGAFIGGAPARPELLERARELGWPILPTWGMTEAASQLATPDPAEAVAMDFAVHPGTALRPLPGVEIRTGHRGAIQVRGPMLFAGYLDEQAAGPDAEGWFTTSDYGVIGPNGEIQVSGRRDNVIISGGINVPLDSVTRQLLDCPLIQDAATVGIEDSHWGQRVAAVVVAGDTAGEPSGLSEALASWARRHMSPAERPARWRIVEKIPKSSVGKPLTPALKSLFE